MLVKINFKNLIAAVAALIVFIMCLNGSILNFIQFADVLNEMLFAFAAFMMFIISLALSFERPKNVNNFSK